MFSTLISSGNTTLKVAFDNQELGEQVLNNTFIQKYIPGLEFREHSEADASILFSDQKIYFDFSGFPQVVIGAEEMSEKDIISLIELVFERVRQEKGVYCIHSAAVIYNQRTIIFWGGASGMGKTRLAKFLSEQGGEFYSDEKTLIDLNTLEVVGGIPYQYLDKDYWKKQLNNTNSDSYYKSGVNLTVRLPMALFVYGFALDGAEFSNELWPAEKFEWHLYEELGRKIRAISRRVKNGGISVPSLDSQENADKRIANIQKLTKTIPCYSIQGTAENIIKFIKELELWK